MKLDGLKITSPELLLEWNFKKNKLHPCDFRPQSNKKVWWVCKEGHEWEARIADRHKGTGCPFCKGKRVLIGFNDLTTTHQELCLEWDQEKNGTLKPSEVSKGSDKYVWWKCKYGHSWEACISSRVSGVGCPICSKGKQTSFPEKAMLYYLKKHLKNVVPNYKSAELGFLEIDIYIPEYRIGVEYDGEMWHKDIRRDLSKNELCRDKKITLIRIREPKCPILPDDSSYNIFITNKKTGLKTALIELFEYIEHLTGLHIDHQIDLSRDSVSILSLTQNIEESKSIALEFPELLEEWNFEKNNGINPKSFSAGSDKKVWWVCKKNHTYISSISNRVRGRGCPICSGKKLLKDFNDFQSRCPDLAKEWDFEKNYLKPDEVAFGTDAKFWWNCFKGHSYESSINNRRAGNGCHYCSGQRVIAGENDLQTLNPSIAKEWNYEKNSDFNPKDFTPKSHKKVWWKCNLGHEWEAPIYNRTAGSGCPYCSGRYVVKGENDLKTVNPILAGEWNYKKNLGLTPEDVKPNSNKKVWWICIKGHEWEATISNRNQGKGCPYCSGRKKQKV